MVFTAIDELLGIAVGTTEVAYTANLSVDLRLKCPLLQTLKCVGKIENVRINKNYVTRFLSNLDQLTFVKLVSYEKESKN